jgi:quinol monooxygenase YgiN
VTAATDPPIDSAPDPGARNVGPPLEIAVLTASFDARPGGEEALLGALARYVVLTRQEPACRNVDLVASVTHGGRFLIIEKWESAAAIQRHLDSPLMTEMARAATAEVATKPTIDVYDSISAYDLI